MKDCELEIKSYKEQFSTESIYLHFYRILTTQLPTSFLKYSFSQVLWQVVDTINFYPTSWVASLVCLAGFFYPSLVVEEFGREPLLIFTLLILPSMPTAISAQLSLLSHIFIPLLTRNLHQDLAQAFSNVPCPRLTPTRFFANLCHFSKFNDSCQKFQEFSIPSPSLHCPLYSTCHYILSSYIIEA